jgi:TRAP-type mannitol/chloroaromatic compound transport system permease large subunit
MSMLALGLLFGAVTLIVMFSGMPIAFSLGVVAVAFMFFFMPAASLDTVTQNVYEEMASITLLSIPLFILKGAAIGKSPAGRDLYLALHVWMSKVPGLLLVGLFALYAVYRYRKKHRAAIKAYADHGTESAYLDETRYSLREKFEMLPRVVPFVVLLIGVMVALYGGYATPSETAGLGAVLALALIAIVYGIWRQATWRRCWPRHSRSRRC